MKKFLVTALSLLMVAGCSSGGNGGGSSSGSGDGYSHNELAGIFVDELNATGVYDVSLAKASTLQFDFIVIYDHDFQEWVAVDIGFYDVGEDPVYYLEVLSPAVFFDLEWIPAHWETEVVDVWDSFCGCYVTEVNDVWVPDRYYDWETDLLFEKTKASSKDLEQYAALVEEKVVSSRAEEVAKKFGLSVDRSKEVVRLAMAWKKAGGKDLTAADQDAFSAELLGFSITEAKSAAKKFVAGDTASLDQLVDQAAETNGTSPENVRKLIGSYFGI